MRAFVALIRREYLEHRGAFFYAPMILTVLFVLGTLLPFLSGHFHSFSSRFPGSTTRFYEMGYIFGIGIWWAYLVVTLFFYYADAFSADKRNNAMLFWKSMPLSDFKVLSAKMAAGLTLFPLVIFIAMLVAGIWSYVMTVMGGTVMPVAFVTPDFGSAVNAFVQISVAALVFMVLALLWLAPFFAWVGALSTAVGRWSIPLAFLVPGVLVLLENAVLPSDGTPRGGFIADYLRHRGSLGFARDAVEAFVRGVEPFSAVRFIGDMVSRIDWMQMVAGWAVVVVLVVVASEYRRRVVD